MLTLRTFAILFNVCRSGCDALEHQRLAVVVLTPSCSASHLPVFFCSTKTTFNLFKSFIVILFKFNAKVLTYFEIAIEVHAFLYFYNDFHRNRDPFIITNCLGAWYKSIIVFISVLVHRIVVSPNCIARVMKLTNIPSSNMSPMTNHIISLDCF